MKRLNSRLIGLINIKIWVETGSAKDAQEIIDEELGEGKVDVDEIEDMYLAVSIKKRR